MDVGEYGDDADGLYGIYGSCEFCMPEFGQCGGGELIVTACCADGLQCTQKNAFFAQCLTAARAEANVATEGWVGTQLECGTVLEGQ